MLRFASSRFVAGFIVVLLLCGSSFAADPQAFEVRVVDAATGRGVPLVELRTTSNVRYYTDNTGRVAVRDPGLMGQRVFFHVKSHGYRHADAGFGYEGRAVDVEPGGDVVIEIERENVAERVYRVTGQGLFGQSVQLGHEPPLRKPTLNAQVVGQDSVQTAIYNGRLYWFWGDTSRVGFPLGNFRTTGATSPLPGETDLPRDVGINLDYFESGDGFVRQMAPLPADEGNLVWIDRLITVPDADGRERLVARYSQRAGLDRATDHGLLIFNDRTKRFDLLKRVDLVKPSPDTRGHAVATRYEADGRSYWFFTRPWPTVRVLNNLEAVQDAAAYESFTCLAPGTEFADEDSQVNRDADGRLIWEWRAGAQPITQQRERALIEAGLIEEDEARFQLRDVETGEAVVIHGASVRWNDYRQKWVMIGNQIGGGPSLLGEVWYAEADSPTGPWRWARRIVTHDQYTFYNPSQHAFMDEEGGRVIYFEGTYTNQFSGTDVPTPYYDYNQIMYRLDLGSDRLDLPLQR